jgi:hypothetical protein
MASNGLINRAQAGVTRSVKQPVPRKGANSQIGNERDADMKGALKGNPVDKNPITKGNDLQGAVRELKSQHPSE